MNHLSKVLTLLIALTLPSFSFAQQMAQTIIDADSVFERVVRVVFAPLYTLAASLAVLYFLYGVVRFIIDMNNPEKKNTGKEHLLWGTIGLFIIFSVGGITSILGGVFGSLFGGM